MSKGLKLLIISFVSIDIGAFLLLSIAMPFVTVLIIVLGLSFLIIGIVGALLLTDESFLESELFKKASKRKNDAES